MRLDIWLRIGGILLTRGEIAVSYAVALARFI